MFYQCTALTEIVVPEGMTRIGEKAFWECEKLQSVTLPESLAEIGADAFGGIHPKAVFHCPEGSEAERLIAQMQSADE